MPITFVPEPVSESGNHKYVGASYPATPVAGSAQHNLALTNVAGQALTVPGIAVYGNVQAKTATVSYTTDGTVPSATVGIVIPVAATPLTFPASVLAVALFYSATGTLDVEYFS